MDTRTRRTSVRACQIGIALEYSRFSGAACVMERLLWTRYVCYTYYRDRQHIASSQKKALAKEGFLQATVTVAKSINRRSRLEVCSQRRCCWSCCRQCRSSCWSYCCQHCSRRMLWQTRLCQTRHCHRAWRAWSRLYHQTLIASLPKIKFAQYSPIKIKVTEHKG